MKTLLALLALTPMAAFAQTSVYCSAPVGYAAFNCDGTVCEDGTDFFYGGYIGPSLDVSSNDTNCAPLTSWQYYSLTDPPGDPPATGPQLTSFSSPSAAPELNPKGTIGGITLLLGSLAILVGAPRRSRLGRQG